MKSMIVGFAVFVGGVIYVVKRLTAFIGALTIILLAFTQIFYTLFRQMGEYCPMGTSNGIPSIYVQFYTNVTEVCAADDPTDCVDPAPKTCEPINDNPWCNFGTSFIRVYTMLLGEVDETDFGNNKWATFFFALFMFGVVIVLANVLIAIVTDSYSVIKNERAGELSFVAVLLRVCHFCY